MLVKYYDVNAVILVYGTSSVEPVFAFLKVMKNLFVVFGLTASVLLVELTMGKILFTSCGFNIKHIHKRGVFVVTVVH